MATFPYPLSPRFNRVILSALDKSPLSTISTWMTQKKKTITVDPIQGKTKVTKELDIDADNVREVLLQLADKINDIVQVVEAIPEIEGMIISASKIMNSEIQRLESEIAKLTAMVNMEDDKLNKKVTDIENYINGPLAIQLGQDSTALGRHVEDFEKTNIARMGDIDDLQTTTDSQQKYINTLQSDFSRDLSREKRYIKTLQSISHDTHDHEHNITPAAGDYQGTYTHTHPISRKGGLLRNGGFTKPVIAVRRDNLKRKLIKDIERLQK